MQTGTIEKLDEDDLSSPTSRRSRIGGGGPSGRGGGDNNGGGSSGPGGDSGRGPQEAESNDAAFVAKSRILTTFLLIVVVMTFGGLIAAYVVLKTNGTAEWRPFDLPPVLWFSTLMLIASSVTYYLSERELRAGQQTKAKRFLLTTTVLGAVFVAAQGVTWLELNRRGIYVQGNPYTGFFYILTAVHAAHVVGGIVALSSVVLRAWYPTHDAARLNKTTALARVVGWYWHFVGLIWLVIVGLLGFLK